MDLAELSKQIGVDLVKDADDLEVVKGEYKTKFFLRDREGNGMALKAWSEKTEGSDDEDMFLSGVASSTIKDLHGDTMLPSALIDMEKSAKNNLTIFLNHEYKVPRDVAGSVVNASLVATGDLDENGAPLYDLSFDKIRINKRNKDAVESWQAMKDGTKLGLSIGAKIPEGGAIRNKKTGTLLIAHVNLLETSIVGIPANPRSWIDSVAKSIKSGPVNTAVTIEASAVTIEASAVPEAEPETIVSDDVSSSADDPSTTTDSPSQDLTESDPENEGTVATPDVVAAATDVLERTADTAVPDDQVRDLLTEAHNALAAVTNSYIDVKASVDVAEQRAKDAEVERDEMRSNTENVIREVANLIEQVGNLPAGRVASFKAIQQAAAAQSETFEGLGLAPEVVRMLRSSNT